MRHNSRYQFKHLSLRVPWHDKGWNGCVCDNVYENSSCLVLKNCALKRDDEKEDKEGIKGVSIKKLEEKDYPVCVSERGTFMANFSFDKYITHPYIELSPTTHGHLRKTILHFPAYSAPAVPYYWMRKEHAVILVDKYDLNYDENREPQLDWQDEPEYEKGWIQEYQNQKALLNCFFEHLDKERSLVFIYAKRVPFVESTERVIVGVGRVKDIIDSDKYDGSNSHFSAGYWENMILHSIRPNMEDGFLLPYYDAIEFQKEHPDFDPSELAVIAPSDKNFEFSYASEHVSNDSAIRVLLNCYQVWQKAKEKGIGENHERALSWIHDELQRIQKVRGCYPGMGAALCAFGIEKGHFIAAEIINNLKNDTENPWEIFGAALDNPKDILSNEVASLIPTSSKKLYQRLLVKEKSDRLNLLYLLSRFELSIDQAERIFVKEERELLDPGITDEQILKNPYLIYELNIHQIDPVSLYTIDLGLYLKNKPSDLLPADSFYEDPQDSYRVRAITIQQLQLSATLGHTLMPRKELVKQIRTLPIIPKCNIDSDYYELAEDVFPGAIEKVKMKDGSCAYQLKQLTFCSEIIREKVTDRLNGQKLTVADKWKELLLKALDQSSDLKVDEREEKARVEKLAALRNIASSRFSVLIGPAGTGKTTLLTVFASHPEINKNGVLLLAPTGKARVRMEQIAKGLDVTAKTLAQFLNGYDRFDGTLQRYIFSERTEDNFETVILDEASMLTEEMLATTLDCLKHSKRFILVGDHRQLPPIGAGRPFVDIVNFLKQESIETTFPRVSKGFSELTIKMRQGGSKREDLQLAEWFSGEPLEPGADQIINDILTKKVSPYLEIVNWENESDFEKKFEDVLVKELELSSINDIEHFNLKLGSVDGRYFNNSLDAEYFDSNPAVENIDDWQILSPIKERLMGVRAINRKIHKLFRKDKIEYAIKGRTVNGYNNFTYTEKKIPKPLGIEQIVYGDKVINLGNHSRDYVYPKENSLTYLANGEIGIVTGQFKRKKAKYRGQPKYVEIEFSSQKGFVYSFTSFDFKDENDPPLELAYALTVHKAQGSEFEKVFLIIPNPCFLLTRELLYTALTRQRQKIIVLFQGKTFDIKTLSSQIYSDTLKRITNLFTDPELIEVDGQYLEKNLIHQASDGKMLRSKSELLIYQRLLDKRISPAYEKKLVIKEVEKLPDFTIENPELGITYYWEHCGMMHDREYVERWEEKYKWYLENNILPWEEGGGRNGYLIVTKDKPTKIEDGSTRGAISVREIDELISKVFHK